MRCPLNTPALLALGALLLAGCSVQSPGQQEAPVLAAPEAAPAPAAISPPAPPPPPSPSFSAYASQPKQSVVVTGSSISGQHQALRRAPPPGFVVIAPPQADKFPDKEANATQLVAEQPVSTFSADVDTASYAFVRRQLTSGRLPPPQAVRVEEMVNYFPYRYAAPKARTEPFAVTTEVMPSPWKAGNQLLHVAVRGFDLQQAERPPLNLVLLIDVSGSMQGPDRLPLLQQGLRLFADQLRENDRVSIVTYANGTQVALEPTLGRDKQKIVDALDGLRAAGGTAGGDGLQRAYALAERHRDPKAVNRVILATDGDFNIGITDPKQLERFIADKRKSGVYLSVFGVGTGNLNDALIQRLTQSGNGNAAYIDSLLEARKAMQEELGSTMFPIANDVKMQVEFNPRQVAAYRLIGYETRILARQDFKDDKVDAGDMGAGHTVTAIYEITPASEAGKLVDPLRYGDGKKAAPAGKGDELCFVKVRYKLPGQATSRETSHAVRAASVRKGLDAAPEDARFAVAVAAFGQRLRGEAPVADYSYADIANLANDARGKDAEGYRAEFVRLVRMAETLGKTGPVGQP
ncbi:VWA domain-containing protein [Massilia sp. IC2-278]|uniref:vWA domain-containing protein n=1 Tax=Massilia sp. IC2-278 TaxID=2887200 RepID=UPI001E378F35|nr:VWA domain-containing protein [Massilia sp. IC2-278]MCC2961524.1 VWA domain-containing protein [Massilia sp. IC2-278]